MTADSSFKLTYSTMFNPPEELHTRYADAITAVKAKLGKEHGMFIDGKEHFTADKFEDHSPTDTSLLLGIFQKGSCSRCQPGARSRAESLPGLAQDPLAGARPPGAQSRRYHGSTHFRDGRGRLAGSGQEPHGGAR